MLSELRHLQGLPFSAYFLGGLPDELLFFTRKVRLASYLPAEVRTWIA